MAKSLARNEKREPEEAARSEQKAQAEKSRLTPPEALNTPIPSLAGEKRMTYGEILGRRATIPALRNELNSSEKLCDRWTSTIRGKNVITQDLLPRLSVKFY